MIKKKKDIIKTLATHEQDVGSTEVQIGLLTDKITKLSEHFKNFKKDNKIPSKICKLTRIKKVNPYIDYNKKKYYPVLEGGAFDVNGKGSVLLTKECLLSKKQERNPGLKKKDYQIFLRKYLPHLVLFLIQTPTLRLQVIMILLI